MKKMLRWMVVLTALSSCNLCAQNIAGTWQGTLKVGKGLRSVLKISKADKGWSAIFYSVDQESEGAPVSSVTLEGSTFKFSLDSIHGKYEGKVNSDGTSITGTWTQGSSSWPLNLQRATKETAWRIDSSPHTVSFITVDKGVKLEVLDWGGSGRPLVLLAGLGYSAHVFDQFAPKLTANYHVYGITRRGFGASSAPAPTNGNYSADRLADDVLAVINALKLNRPVLVGHSIAGEELSSIGSRYPDKVAGLIYLDAGYSYAFYDRSHGDMLLDAIDLRKKLDLWLSGRVQDPKQFVQELQASLPQFEKDMDETEKRLASMPSHPPSGPPPAIPLAINVGEQKYTQIHVPVLAIFADPHDLGPMFKNDPSARAAALADDLASTSAQAKAFQAGIPSAHVVILPNADHFVFRSNEADVLREMKAFLASLPKEEPSTAPKQISSQ